MHHFTSVHDVLDLERLLAEAVAAKANPSRNSDLGRGKTLGLLFLNPSLRTRISTQVAARQLGLEVMVMNQSQEGWALETEEGAVMDGSTAEHVKDAAAVLGSYCNILGLRAFPSLKDKASDYSEAMVTGFVRYASVPVVSLESAIRHPLQSLADLMTVREVWSQAGRQHRPRVLLAWAPHVRPLPQAVPNSFAEWMQRAETEGMLDFEIANPVGLDLAPEFVNGTTITNDLHAAAARADFIYFKNWSSYEPYGSLPQDMPALRKSWLLPAERAGNTYVMHCLPVRRNVEVMDALLDGPKSLVQQQAVNRIWAARAVMTEQLKANA